MTRKKQPKRPELLTAEVIVGRPTEWKTEVRSHVVDPRPTQLPSDTQPCKAPEGHFWVHAFGPRELPTDLRGVGKWLIRVQCRYVDYCWSLIRQATEEGTLGIAAKVSTDWGNRNDPAAPGGRKAHVICVYTYSWQDRDDVLHIGKRLREIDAVRKQTLYYKADAMTYEGIYSQSAPGEVSLYEMRPPHEELTVREDALLLMEKLRIPG